MKKCLSALLCAVLFLSLMPAVFATTGITTAQCSVNETAAFVGDIITWNVFGIDGSGIYSYAYFVCKNGSADYYLPDPIYHQGENSRRYIPPEPGTYYPEVWVKDHYDVMNTYIFNGPETVVTLRPASKITKVEVLGGTRLKITWNMIIGADGYFLERSTNKTTGYKLVKTTMSTSFTDTSLKAGTRYYYRVRSYNVIDGVSWPSSKYSAAIAGITLAKAAITDVSIVSTSQIRLTWKKVAGATGYQVFRSSSKSGTYSALRKISALSIILTDLKPGTTYYFKVRAYIQTGTKTYFGPISGYRSGLTLAKPPQD